MSLYILFLTVVVIVIIVIFLFKLFCSCCYRSPIAHLIAASVMLWLCLPWYEFRFHRGKLNKGFWGITSTQLPPFAFSSNADILIQKLQLKSSLSVLSESQTSIRAAADIEEDSVCVGILRLRISYWSELSVTDTHCLKVSDCFPTFAGN